MPSLVAMVPEVHAETERRRAGDRQRSPDAIRDRCQLAVCFGDLAKAVQIGDRVGGLGQRFQGITGLVQAAQGKVRPRAGLDLDL